MAVALELDPEQVGCAPDNKRPSDEHQPGSPLDLHPAAMRAALDLIDRMYQSGLLDLLRGLASSGGEIASKLTQGADTAQTIRAVRNGIALLSILGTINPEVLQSLASPPGRRQTAQGGMAPAEESPEPPGMWALFRRFSNRDGRRGSALMADVVESVGRAAKVSQRNPAVEK